MKRFLNADSYGSTGQGFLGYNMFAYCNNNPANSTDPTGHKPLIDIVADEVLGEWDTGSDSWGEYLKKHPDHLSYLFGCCFCKTFGTEYISIAYGSFTVRYCNVERTEFEKDLDGDALALVGWAIGLLIPGGKSHLAAKLVAGASLSMISNRISNAIIKDTWERGFFVVDEYSLNINRLAVSNSLTILQRAVVGVLRKPSNAVASNHQSTASSTV